MTEAQRETRRQKRSQLQARQDWEAALAHPPTARVLWEILELCGVYRATFAGEAMSSVFRDGQRSIGIQVIDRIASADPLAYANILKDAAIRATETKHDRDRDAQAARDDGDE